MDATDAAVSLERKARVILDERARRQALVDRALSRSVWSFLVIALMVPIGIGAFVDTVTGQATGVLWLVIALAQVARQVQALARILERSGALSEFVAGASTIADVRQTPA